ncbi:uncharacterized protein LOC108675335 [Hyalella azteca]|uniref:Uncharacterized protein LOC108675335 n=1 Tax=Hyalella azteca TaxID=294128 RepID=A0A8B7P172_HYAAZ|nr:uncharacterized protein LOC108675335 [Hyalella azteca]
MVTLWLPAGRHVAAVAAMLRHTKPIGVEVKMEAAALMGTPWGALVAAARGVGVWLTFRRHEAYEPHDDLLLPLHDSGVKLWGFRGCVGTSAGVAALASVANGAVLSIRMAAPLDLNALENTYVFLSVYTRLLPFPGPPSPAWSRPLSGDSPLHAKPGLIVEGADEGSWEAVAHTFTSLVPPGKRCVVPRLPWGEMEFNLLHIV